MSLLTSSYVSFDILISLCTVPRRNTRLFWHVVTHTSCAACCSVLHQKIRRLFWHVVTHAEATCPVCVTLTREGNTTCLLIFWALSSKESLFFRQKNQCFSVTGIKWHVVFSLLQCVAVCCSVLQCVLTCGYARWGHLRRKNHGACRKHLIGLFWHLHVSFDMALRTLRSLATPLPHTEWRRVIGCQKMTCNLRDPMGFCHNALLGLSD